MTASRPSYRPPRKKIVLHLDRNSVCLLMECLEDTIEAYDREFGMAEEKDLLDFLTDRLHRHDGSHGYRKAVSRV